MGMIERKRMVEDVLVLPLILNWPTRLIRRIPRLSMHLCIISNKVLRMRIRHIWWNGRANPFLLWLMNIVASHSP
jgi:hypothetical protein